MTQPTHESVAALEQWAKQERDYATEMGCGTDYTSVNKLRDVLALCAAWREATGACHEWADLHKAALARAEQAERDKQTLAEVAAQHLKDRDAARAEVARLKSALANARAMAEMASETARDRQ